MSDRTLALILALLALLAGPGVDLLSRRVKSAYTAVDGLVLTAIGGTVLVHVVPHAVEAAGLPALVLVIVGAVAPLALHRGTNHEDKWVIVLGAFGLAVHSALDGAALVMSEDVALTSAVVLHRVPAGIFVWWLVRPSQGAKKAAAVLFGIGVATVIGFLAADYGPPLEGPGVALFESFVAGMLLHVVVGHGTPQHDGSKTAGAIGALVGLAFVFWLPGDSDHDHLNGAQQIVSGLARTSLAAAFGLAALFVGRKRPDAWYLGLAGVPLLAMFVGFAPAGVAALAIVVLRRGAHEVVSVGRGTLEWVFGTAAVALAANHRLDMPSLAAVAAATAFGLLPLSTIGAALFGAAIFVTTGSAGAAAASVVMAANAHRRRPLRDNVLAAVIAFAAGALVDRFLPSGALPSVDALTFAGITVVATLILYELFRRGPRAFIGAP